MTDLIFTEHALTVVQHDTIHWVECFGGDVPHGAVVGGEFVGGEVVYIGRARLRENRGELTPGVVIPSRKCLVLSYGTGVRTTTEYEVLVSRNPDTYCWVPCAGSAVPHTAVIGGLDCSYLEPLYIGRTVGSLEAGRTWRGQRLNVSAATESSVPPQIPGKVHRSHKCLYIPYLEREYLFREFEVLTLKQSPASLSANCKAVIRNTIARSYRKTIANNENDSTLSAIDSYIVESIENLLLPTKLKEYCRDSFTDS